MNADGSNKTRLTKSRNDSYPAWSPDGTKIAFSQDFLSPTSSERGIYVMNVDGSDQRLIRTSDHRGIIVLANGYQPAWSPDGSKLAFTSGGSNIHSINADGSGLTQITSPPIEGLRNDYDFGPAWSPDGAKIAFKRFLSCDYELFCAGSQTWVVNADGGSSGRPLTERFPNALDLADLVPSWSSDGAKIIFSLPTPDRGDLFVMNSDGSGLANITNTASTGEWAPSWHPLSLASCVNSISPTSQSFEVDGGTGSVEVTADSECSWAASCNAGWISVTPGSSSGDGSVVYLVAANTSTSSRTAALVVAGRIVAISQAGVPVRIINASVQGKNLFVFGENFDPGAVILLIGEEQKTKHAGQNPETTLIGKKVGKKIKPGDKLQVRNPNGTLSQEFIFTGS